VREEYQRVRTLATTRRLQMRFVIGVVLGLSVGIGAYLDPAQVAESANAPPRRLTLRLGDIAA